MRIAYQVFGRNPRAVLALPIWPIVHSDFWRLQVPHFVDRYTVVALRRARQRRFGPAA